MKQSLRDIWENTYQHIYNYVDFNQQIKQCFKDLLPEKRLHAHNSIPGYIDGVGEGCCECLRNLIIIQMEKNIEEDK